MHVATHNLLTPKGISSGVSSGISRTPITHPAAPGALNILEQFGCTVMIRRTHEIHRHDSPTDFYWKILSGCARNVNMMEDGRRQITEFRWPGDLIGIDDHGTYDSDAEAVTDATLRRYPRHAIDAHAQIDATLALWLRANTVDHLRHAHRQMILLARKTAVERIASFLLEMNRR